MAQGRQISDVEYAWRNSPNIVNPYYTAEEDAKALEFFRADPARFIKPFLKIAPEKPTPYKGRLTTPGEIIPFDVWHEGQEIVHSMITEMRQAGRSPRLIILKARRVGISTLLLAYAFWRMRFWPRSNARVTSYKTESAEEVFRMSELFLAELPDILRPLKLRNPKNMLRLGNANVETAIYHPGLMSTLISATAKSAGGRGAGFSFLLNTEAAFWPNAVEAYNALFPTLPKGPDSFGFIESTSDGAGNFFHDKFMKAKEAWLEYDMLMREYERIGDQLPDMPEWRPVFLPFFLFDEYREPISEEEALAIIGKPSEYEAALKRRFKPRVTWAHILWMRKTAAGHTEIARKKEYPATVDEAFTAAGTTIFDLNAVMWIRRRTTREGITGFLRVTEGYQKLPYFVEDPEGWLTIWEMPDPGDGGYAIGADAAMGKRHEGDMSEEEEEEEAEDDNRDFCSACVVNSSRRQVAEFNSRVIDAPSFAIELFNLGMFYNYAKMMPEVGPQGAGMMVLYVLRDQLRYPNWGYWRDFDHKDVKTKPYPGWEINWKAKTVLGGTMQNATLHAADMLYTEAATKIKKMPRPVIRSQALTDQMVTFVLHGDGGVGAKSGAHDDLVIAWGLALVCWEQIGGDLQENMRLNEQTMSMYTERDSNPINDTGWMEC